MWQKAHDLQYELMRLFKAQVNTINSNGGRYGYYPNPYKENLTARFKEKLQHMRTPQKNMKSRPI